MISPASQPPGFHCYDGHAGFVSGIATVPSEGRPATHLITLAADDGAMLYLGLWKDLFMGLRCFSTEANWCTKSFDGPWDHNWTYQLGQTAKVSDGYHLPEARSVGYHGTYWGNGVSFPVPPRQPRRHVLGRIRSGKDDRRTWWLVLRGGCNTS